jgi:peptide/nickel transport system ATP-binding protein
MTPDLNSQDEKYLLEVNDLQKYFDITRGFCFRKEDRKYLRAVDGISFKLRQGETLGIVGESGCGKTTTGSLIIRLLNPSGGMILFEGRDITNLSNRQLKPIRRDIQMIFQDPYSSLDPRMRVFDLIAEPFRANEHLSSKELSDEVYRLIDVVGLRRDCAGRFPHEFSGGQRQRIGIARALALKPKLIICDEPISALDVSIQAQILNLLGELQRKFNLTYIFISHALPSIKHISTQVAVMYLGKIVEYANTASIFRQPAHPYTEGLMSAVPIPDPALRDKRQKVILEGDMPSPAKPPSGCHFHTRCRYCTEECESTAPVLKELWPDHYVACHHPLQNAVGTMITETQKS